MIKVCKRCNKSRRLSKRSSICAQCQKETLKAWHKSNYPHIKATWQAYRKRKPEVTMYYGALQRSKRDNRAFNLKITDIFIPKFCPILGLELKTGGGRPAKNSASLDCIDPTKGYIVGNVWVISRLANAMKHDATVDQLWRFAQWVNEVFGDRKVWEALPVVTRPSSSRLMELLSIPRQQLQIQ